MMAPEPESEAGFTVIEMSIVSAVLLVVVAMLLPLIAGSLNLFTNTQVRSDAVDNVQLALSQISHDVVSSNLLYIDPGTGIVHVETYSKSGTSTCVEYQVLYPAAPATQEATLQRRTKSPGSAHSWSASWTNVMTGIVNKTQPGNPVVFSVPSSSQYQSLVVNMWVQTDTRASNAAAPEDFTSQFTGPAIPANVPPPTDPLPATEPC